MESRKLNCCRGRMSWIFLGEGRGQRRRGFALTLRAVRELQVGRVGGACPGQARSHQRDAARVEQAEQDVGAMAFRSRLPAGQGSRRPQGQPRVYVTFPRGRYLPSVRAQGGDPWDASAGSHSDAASRSWDDEHPRHPPPAPSWAVSRAKPSEAGLLFLLTTHHSPRPHRYLPS